MSEYPYGRVPRPRRSRTGRRIVKAATIVVAAGAVFALGVALGKALEDGPQQGKTITYVRTLQPLRQQPVSTP